MKLVIIFAAFIVAISALSDHEHWTEFKTKHSKNYSLVEDKIRFQIFQDNLRKIEVHNAKYEKGEVSYFFKVTKFADWTSEEFKNILKAQFGDRPTANTFKPKPNFTAPVSLDWRDSNAVSEVKDQGVCGACWAFSVTGTIESQLILKKNQRSSLSEQELVDCDDKLYGCNGGDTALAYVYVQSNGLYSEEQYPYTAKDGTCRQVDGDKPIKTLSGYEFVDTDEDLVAEAIASVGPVSVAVEANSDWQLYGGGIFDHSDCGDDVNHAVLGVGYTSEYWIIKNSWSESWGENGYIRLVRGKSQCGVAEYVSYVIL